ncbi:hypothetical protein BH20BAC1_BH20BAC1_01600 [soil metagenome]
MFLRYIILRSAMKQIFLTLIVIPFFVSDLSAQTGYTQEGEFGLTIGSAHYFGDINNRAAFNRPKIAAGVYFRKQFGNYTAVRLTGHFAQLGYSDRYSKNDFQQKRNLSFNTNIFELALRGDFNFFRFNPAVAQYSFTPYVTFGVGVFSFDPYAFYDGQKYFLRPLNTEGQTFYEDRKAYGTVAISIPIGFGVKYAITDKVNISFEIAHRFTTTDYLDDVSKTYIGANNFTSQNNGSIAKILQDRSFEFGTPIGVEGRQRGWNKQKDQFAIAEFGISFNITSYKCPEAKL